MKTISLFFIAITTTCFAIISCKKNVNQLSLLPPITDTGANTFGCLVNGVAMLPKSGMPTWNNPYITSPVEVSFKSEIRISIGNPDGPATSMFFYLYNLYSGGLVPFFWKQSEFGAEAFPVYNSQLYGMLLNSNTNKYEWYGSFNNSGLTTISKFDTVNHVIAGIFNGKLVQKNGTDTITISNGRFDINWRTIQYKKF